MNLFKVYPLDKLATKDEYEKYRNLVTSDLTVRIGHGMVDRTSSHYAHLDFFSLFEWF